LEKNRNFGQKSKFWPKIQILVKNPNFGKKNANFGQKSKFWSKIQISAKIEKYMTIRTLNLTYFFSIDRVFRNETLDATHLAEFHQVEGLIADYNVSLADMIGVLHTFFKKLGMEKLKFKVRVTPFLEGSKLRYKI